jgi:exopolyphosphatase/guanosine-5'-triphosphate,3'-diphosphate pyrophosphatase
LESYNDLITVKKKKEDLSIIDLGYNSIKVSTYSIYKNGHYKKQEQQQEYAQIGYNLFKNDNIIKYQNIERAVKFLNKIKNDLKQMKINTVIPIATSAVRDADNRNDVVNTIKKNSGFKFNVLSGLEEGFFSYVGAQSIMHVPNGIFFDLGGGSIEIIHVQNYKIKKIICLNLGALRLSEKFVKSNENLEGEGEEPRYKQLEKYLYKNIPTIDQFDMDKTLNMKLVGIGGNIRTIYKFISRIFQNSQSFSYNHITMTKKMIDLSNVIFKRLSQEELLQIKSIDPQRSKTITTGSYVVKILMEKLGFNNILICPTGLREGILENYLYFDMDKKYRLRKKFFGLNYDDLSSIVYSNNLDHFSKSGIKNPSSLNPSNPLFVSLNEHGENFPKKILSAKVNKIAKIK